ncbi:TPA: radical SAM protein, partial [Candidatus Woesearchaeota archaeon]|nr:radical SAM protein [Candidatus Woesearchaeota archaeon]
AEGHEVELIDANGFNIGYPELEKEISDKNYDVMIFRFTPTTFDHDMRTAVISKSLKSNALVVGICLTLHSLAKEVLESAPALDIYIGRDYETIIPQLIKNTSCLERVEGIAYRSSRGITVNGAVKKLADYDSLPIPAYDLLPSFKPYFINTPTGTRFSIVYTSKGCPFRCIYCTVAGTRLKMRSAESVAGEVRILREKYDIRVISFFDETFTLSRERTLRLCRLIKPLGVKWYCNTRANLVDRELLETMYGAGCRGISFGVESGSQRILDAVSKGVSVGEQAEAIRLAKAVGIKVFCSFIFGLPGETRESIDETIGFVKRSLPTSAQFNVAVPYPGTELYKLAREKGCIENEDWRALYQDSSVMSVGELSPGDLDNARRQAYRALYFNPRWILQNILHVARHTDDFTLAARYVVKIINNYFFHRMVHAH